MIVSDTRQYSSPAHLSACREGRVILLRNADTPHALFPWRAALQWTQARIDISHVFWLWEAGKECQIRGLVCRYEGVRV